MVDINTPRFQRLIPRIGQLNAADPNQDQGQPRELAYAKRLSAWVDRLAPDASESLRIAARGQHVQRWTIPRERYPRNRQGYLRWRETLKTFHADTITRLMQEEGYSDELRERVRRIILKKQLGSDPDTQTLEDALCLIFLETQLADLMTKEPPEKMREILRKTWTKMSDHARSLAQQLPLTLSERALLQEALA